MDIQTIDGECLVEQSVGDYECFEQNRAINIDRECLIEKPDGDYDIHCEDSDSESVTPRIGMLFTTQDEAFKFYNKYALKMGFGIRKSTTSFSRIEKSKCIGRKFVYNKESLKKLSTETTLSQRRVVRLGCNAAMIIRLTVSGEWIVRTLVLEHNHEMSTPFKSSKHRSHKKIHKQSIVKNLITQLHSEGISNATIARVVNTFKPDPSHVITSQQVHEHLRIERKNNLGKSCAMIVNHFLNKKARDDRFYFNIEVTDDCTLRSMFWADRRSQESYKKFSDVIIFDVTYRTNTFSLPFAPFTGIVMTLIFNICVLVLIV